MDNDPKEERKREILMAALQAFSEKGFDKTTVEDIVRISGLSKGTLYWYFTNKEAIFTELVRFVFEEFGHGFEAALQQTANDPPPERLRHLLLSFTPTLDGSTDWIGLYADFFIQAWHSEALRAVFREGYQSYVELIEPIVQQGIDEGIFRPVDVELATRVLLGALDGYWFQQILEFGEAQPVLALYADAIIRGFMTDDANSR